MEEGHITWKSCNMMSYAQNSLEELIGSRRVYKARRAQTMTSGSMFTTLLLYVRHMDVRAGVIVQRCGQNLGLGLVDRNRTIVYYQSTTDKEIGDRHMTWKSCDRVQSGLCCDNHLSQGQMIIQGVNLLVEVSSGEFTRELDKESLLNQSPIYTKHAWSVLPLFNPILMSMLHPHSYLMFYSRPPCVFHVP